MPRYYWPKQKSFIVGDLNYNLANHDNSYVSNFAQLMLEKSYFPVINLPSQLSDSNVTVLDHIWQIHKAIKLNQELFYTPSLITYLFFFVQI